ncbi:MAG: pyridoxal phosphate-dependent aminotransferase [Bacteroidota bacterium]
MPKISSKGQNMPPSPIRKLVPYAEAAKKRGGKVIHLNIGQPDIKTPKIALDAVKNSNLEVLAYSRTEGSEEYRKKITGYYARHDIEVTPNQIIVTTGGSEALSFTMGAILDHGDEIIIPEPFYANYNGFAEANGIKVVPIASSMESNFSLPPIAKFEEKITALTKAILICNPGNPTGYLYTHEEILQLVELVKKHNLFLVADEVYREFAYDDKKHYSILRERDVDQHTIMVDSVSKRYSMCGARIGCVVSRNESVIEAVLKFAQARLSPPTLAQIASEAALDTPQAYFDEVRQEYVSRRDVLVSELEKINGIKIARPSGAFYCVAELPVADADHFAQWLLEDFEIEGETVMVAPAGGFYATPNLGKNQIRIAYVLEKRVLLRAVHILAEGLKQYTSIGN